MKVSRLPAAVAWLKRGDAQCLKRIEGEGRGSKGELARLRRRKTERPKAGSRAEFETIPRSLARSRVGVSPPP